MTRLHVGHSIDSPTLLDDILLPFSFDIFDLLLLVNRCHWVRLHSWKPAQAQNKRVY
jgi:hypothetical protein